MSPETKTELQEFVRWLVSRHDQAVETTAGYVIAGHYDKAFRSDSHVEAYAFAVLHGKRLLEKATKSEKKKRRGVAGKVAR